jgi:hypothetical protein
VRVNKIERPARDHPPQSPERERIAVKAQRQIVNGDAERPHRGRQRAAAAQVGDSYFDSDLALMPHEIGEMIFRAAPIKRGDDME